MPKISVVIPNFNKAKYILNTLESLQNQTFEDWEAVIVDDSSDDESVSIVSLFVEKDSRFRLFVNELSEGGSSSRNRGLRVARGEYVLFLDSDDLLSKSCLENRLNVYRENIDCDFIISPMGTFVNNLGDRDRVWRPKSREAHLLKFLRHDLPWSVMQPTWRRSFLLSINGFDSDYPRLQDVELHTRALMAPKVSYHIIQGIEPDCFYRICEDRIVSDKAVFMQRRVSGVCIYLRKMATLIRCHGDSERRRLCALKGTYLNILSQLYYQRSSLEFSERIVDELLMSLSQIGKKIELFSKVDRYILKIYERGLALGVYKLKGYNFLFRSWFNLGLFG